MTNEIKAAKKHFGNWKLRFSSIEMNFEGKNENISGYQNDVDFYEMNTQS